MTARNAPCPCGSGRKFKRCHGINSNQENARETPLQSAAAAMERGQVDEALRLAGQAENSAQKFRFLVHARIRRRKAGDLEKARKALEHWRELEPSNPEPWQREIEIHLFENRPDKAGLALRELRQRAPGHSIAHYFQGVLEQLAGKLENSLEAYAEAISAAEGPGQKVFSEDKSTLRVAAAMQLCDTAAGNYPGSGGVQQQGMFERRRELALLETLLIAWEGNAEQQPETVLPEVRNRFSEAWYNLGSAAQAAYTRDDGRLLYFEKAIALNPNNLKARLGKVFSLNYSTSLSPADIFRQHMENGRWMIQEYGRKTQDTWPDAPAGQRLRVGYLSSDFRTHSVAHFILPIVREHDREKVEVYLYHNHPASDTYTERFEGLADRFRRVASLSDPDLYQLIRTDRIDVLVDLNGLTEYNRLPVLCQRPSPVQISWIGYPNTTGLDTVDFRIVDEVTDPPGSSASRHTETLIHMPNTFSVYQAPDDLPSPGPLPCRANGHITFGSFNSLPKLNDGLVQTWSRLLKRDASWKILVKNMALGFAEPRRQLLEVFQRHGIGPEQVELRGATAGQKEHLEAICEVDISLDSFPYNGTTTTCESLILGVPVVTRAGEDHRSRVGASQLRALGLESLVGRTEDEYVDIASALATDRERLQALRSGLPGRMRASALMDASGFTRALETRLLKAWEEKMSGAPG